MIILNLLSPDKKKNLAAEVGFSQVKKALLILIISCITGISMTVAVRVLLTHELHTIESDISSATESLTTNGDDTAEIIIKKINDKGTQLTQIQSSYVSWSSLLYQLGQTPNNNIQLKSLQFNQDDGTFDVQGYAKTRDDLLVFKEALEQLPFLQNINSPISNLIKKEDITFQFTGIFNSDNLNSDENTQS